MIGSSVKIHSVNPALLSNTGLNVHKVSAASRPYIGVADIYQAEMPENYFNAGQIIRYWQDHLPADVLSAFGGIEGKRFLDIGCQAGSYVAAAGWLNAEIAVGLDIEVPQIAFNQMYTLRQGKNIILHKMVSREDLGDPLENVFFEVGDATTLDGFADDYFDFINCLYLLDYLSDADRIRPIDIWIRIALSNCADELSQWITKVDQLGVVEGTIAIAGDIGLDERAINATDYGEDDIWKIIDNPYPSVVRSNNLLSKYHWQNQMVCSPLVEMINSPRIRALMRMLEVIRRGGLIQIESRCFGVPIKNYLDDLKIMIYLWMIPKVETNFLFTLAAAQLNKERGGHITVEPIPSSNIFGLYRVIKEK